MNVANYTHQWRNRPDLSIIAMASVHNLEEREAARALGFRTYRGLKPDEEPAKGEVYCPYHTHGVQCVACLLCDGKRGPEDKRKDIVIPWH